MLEKRCLKGFKTGNNMLIPSLIPLLAIRKKVSSHTIWKVPMHLIIWICQTFFVSSLLRTVWHGLTSIELNILYLCGNNLFTATSQGNFLKKWGPVGRMRKALPLMADPDPKLRGLLFKRKKFDSFLSAYCSPVGLLCPNVGPFIGWTSDCTRGGILEVPVY